MNKNHEDDTTCDQNADTKVTHNEETTIEETAFKGATSNDTEDVNHTNKSGLKRAAKGVGSGLLIGGVSATLMGMKTADPDSTHENHVNDNHENGLSNPEWTDGHIQVATIVNDDMTFNEAFEAARSEVGAGGCFGWHGNVYTTYTADEWGNMTAEERTEYGNHFNWDHIDHSLSNVAPAITTLQSSINTHTTSVNAGDDIDVVSVNHENDIIDLTDQQSDLANQSEAEVVLVSQFGHEVEILGVTHDNEAGNNIGGMTVDDQEVILIDVDGDPGIDYMAADLNSNGVLDPNECIDIQGQSLTVNNLGGFTDPIASNNTPDHSTDVYES